MRQCVQFQMRLHPVSHDEVEGKTCHDEMDLPTHSHRSPRQNPHDVHEPRSRIHLKIQSAREQKHQRYMVSLHELQESWTSIDVGLIGAEQTDSEHYRQKAIPCPHVYSLAFRLQQCTVQVKPNPEECSAQEKGYRHVDACADIDLDS